jgi:hypothetical protein
MSFLNAVINNVEGETLREELQDRVDIILHKIKFMDKIPVACLDRENWPSPVFNEIIEAVGGIIQEDAKLAKVVIYQEPNVGIMELMGTVPSLLDQQWPSVEYNRVYLLENDRVTGGKPDDIVGAMEDMVEMLYPGYFVFGNEGRTWTSFGV